MQPQKRNTLHQFTKMQNTDVSVFFKKLWGKRKAKKDDEKETIKKDADASAPRPDDEGMGLRIMSKRELRRNREERTNHDRDVLRAPASPQAKRRRRREVRSAERCKFNDTDEPRRALKRINLFECNGSQELETFGETFSISF
mmetsp:Transcript_31868/g.62362  ORF Transcript_31868/g.62362 Transcript_31868/m.62362 type:complete len:143 (-) Transcript_31868:249-677(-)